MDIDVATPVEPWAVGWRCLVCGATRDIGDLAPWRCPAGTDTDRHHLLGIVNQGEQPPELDDPNPYVRYGPRLAWWAAARANGLSHDDCVALTREVATGFHRTPFAPSAVLSEEFGLDVWVKDETGDVAGSHKARHLVTILLHLRAVEALGRGPAVRPPLAIASCGNAAYAASTLAARLGWEIDVFVPTWMDPAFGVLLDGLGASCHASVRGPADPPGDPAVRRFRDAVAAGAIPFSVQGPENALCLDGGRTLGWEMVDDRPARIFVQVGGGAFASCVGAGLGPSTALHAVQMEGCAPLVRAWDLAAGIADPEHHWAELMTPWADPHSIADGILDDETYDWLGVIAAMRASGGAPVVAREHDVHEAHALAHRAGFPASHTGVAGLAGLLATRGLWEPGERVAVITSGVQR